MDRQSEEKRQTAVKEFRGRIQDCTLYDSTDEYLLKWLNARNFNVDEAEKMLRNSLAWRKTVGADDIESWTPPEVLTKYFSIGQVGRDKYGCPVLISAQGRMDMRGMLQSVTKKDFMRFQLWTMEKMNRQMLEESKRTGINKACQMVFISDLEHLSMRQMTYKPVMDCGLEQTKIYEAHYPENMRRIFVINAPKFFMAIFNMLKPFLHQATIDKMKFFGTNKKEWSAALLEEIDADQLPAHYGGSMVDPDGDPKCPSKFNIGGEVPLSYYMSNSAPVAKDYMDTVNIIAGAGGWKKYKFNVDVPNSILRWEFMSEGGDIGFRVYYKNKEEGTADVVSFSRIESHLFMEEGELICSSTGKYVVVFDNTFSIVRPKKVRYHIAVEPPLTSTVNNE